MKTENQDTQTFISRMPVQMHKELRFISMYTGMTMQDIGNYAIQKEIELFKSQIPGLKELSDETSKDIINKIKTQMNKSPEVVVDKEEEVVEDITNEEEGIIVDNEEEVIINNEEEDVKDIINESLIEKDYINTNEEKENIKE